MTEFVTISGTKSMFGDQVLSSRSSAPQAKFGTAKRTSPIYIEGQEDLLLGRTGPGHKYDLSSSLGPQTLAQRETAPSHPFGGRPDLSAVSKDPFPGPGEYAKSDAIGAQLLSTRRTAESPRFKSSNRWSNYKSDFRREFASQDHYVGQGGEKFLTRNTAPIYSFSGKAGRYDPMRQAVPGQTPTYLKSPAPGKYHTEGAFGPQMMSKKESAPQNRIGTAPKEKRDRIYVSRAHEKDRFGIFSPGPNVYGQVSSLGPQANSRKVNPRLTRFGSSDRFSDVKPIRPRPTPSDNLGATGTALKALPGPGEYTV